MKEQQHARWIAAWGKRPLAAHAVAIDGHAFDIVGDRPIRADFVEPRAPLCPSDRPWF